MDTPGRPAVAVLGTGRLAEAISYEASKCNWVLRVGPADIAALAIDVPVIVVSDCWNTSQYPQVRHDCSLLPRPWCPVHVELGYVILGPSELPGGAGCGVCGELRRRNASSNRIHVEEVHRQNVEALSAKPSSWLTNLACDTVSAIVADEILALQPASSLPARTRQALIKVDLLDLSVSRHTFLPDPACVICGDLPQDNAEMARLDLRPRKMLSFGDYRVRRLDLERLIETYVDHETGLIRDLRHGTFGGVAVADAEIPLRRHGKSEHGVGRTRSYRDSQLVAILEALERYGGTVPGGKETAVRTSFRQIADQALDPRLLGVHPPESYDALGFGFRRFAEDEECRWVWGYSFRRAAPILVPESCAYYHLGHQDRPFVYEISNGCALGGYLEEAILYGLLEAAERDAFLLTWYARLPVPQINLDGCRDRAIPLQAGAISAETGYEILAFDTTLEHGVPTTWVMAVDPRSVRAHEERRPAGVCAAGAHMTLEAALLNAISELGPILSDSIHSFPEEADRADAMAADSSLVNTMRDHSVLYGSPIAFKRLDFLTRSTRRQRTPPADSLGHDVASDDLRDILMRLIQRYLASGLDVIVVDQTAAEHRAADLACVKVLVPGLVPMTFGHQNRRIHGLARLRHVPHLLGYRSAPIRTEDLNPYPHPFP